MGIERGANCNFGRSLSSKLAERGGGWSSPVTDERSDDADPISDLAAVGADEELASVFGAGPLGNIATSMFLDEGPTAGPRHVLAASESKGLGTRVSFVFAQ